jgi:hypothetical protein
MARDDLNDSSTIRNANTPYLANCFVVSWFSLTPTFRFPCAAFLNQTLCKMERHFDSRKYAIAQLNNHIQTHWENTMKAKTKTKTKQSLTIKTNIKAGNIGGTVKIGTIIEDQTGGPAGDFPGADIDAIG